MTKRIVKIIPAVLFSLMIMALAGQGMAEESKKEDVKVGTSCAGIDPMSIKFVCLENTLLFCSSYSDYKYKMKTTCKPDQECTVAPDGKSASCKYK